MLEQVGPENKPAAGSARCPDRATRASARVRWNRARQARRKEMKVNEGTECGRRSLSRLGVDTPRPARWDRRALPSCAGAQAARLGHRSPARWWSRRDRLLPPPPPGFSLRTTPDRGCRSRSTPGYFPPSLRDRPARAALVTIPPKTAETFLSPLSLRVVSRCAGSISPSEFPKVAFNGGPQRSC